MPDTHTVRVTLDVTPEAAVALRDPVTRERVARLVSRAVRPAGVEHVSRPWTRYRRMRAACGLTRRTP